MGSGFSKEKIGYNSGASGNLPGRDNNTTVNVHSKVTKVTVSNTYNTHCNSGHMAHLPPDELVVSSSHELKYDSSVDKNTDPSSLPGPSSDIDTVPSVLADLTVSDIKHHDVGCNEVRSIVFMPSEHVVLACLGDGLKVLDKHFKPLSQLSLYSVCACKVSDTEVLVSQGYKKQIQFVDVKPKMVAKNILTIGRVSDGVYYHNGDIYVACHDNPGQGEICVVQMDGTVVRSLGFNDGTYMFTWAWDVKVNNAGDKVFVTDWGTHTLTCLDQKGGVIYKYTDTDMKYPTGMLVDRQDNVLVTTCWSQNTHVVNKEGRKCKILLTSRDGLNEPRCISYRHYDGLMAIGMDKRGGTGALMTVKTTLA